MIHRAFFGDAEYDFALPLTMIQELERKTGAGIGALGTRLFNRVFSLNDMSETIRCALIGGSMSPECAAKMIATYVTGRPLMETYPLAVAILETLWFGKATPIQKDTDDQA